MNVTWNIHKLKNIKIFAAYYYCKRERHITQIVFDLHFIIGTKKWRVTFSPLLSLFPNIYQNDIFSIFMFDDGDDGDFDQLYQLFF